MLTTESSLCDAIYCDLFYRMSNNVITYFRKKTSISTTYINFTNLYSVCVCSILAIV